MSPRVIALAAAIGLLAAPAARADDATRFDAAMAELATAPTAAVASLEALAHDAPTSPLAPEALLLAARAAEEQLGEFTRVGGEKSLRTDCRVVAATHRDLEQMVKDGQFREDLFFRLNVVPIRSPGLRERPDDVPLLVESFIRECCDENGFAYKPISEEALARLKRYDWPGNVRELRNVVAAYLERAQEVEAVVLAQLDVEQDELDVLGREQLLRLDDRAGLVHLEAFALEHHAQGAADVLLVIDDEHVHGRGSSRLCHGGGSSGGGATIGTSSAGPAIAASARRFFSASSASAAAMVALTLRL